ncbi:hypothetical protein C2G38_2136432 [Gigaspora rosea]|uniref:Uncharacterized protein n=1 Tax=Gigaspora rosea TaxID=44941 RepID=A0A397W9Y0_9GLOM|nr:hypothetical protein C2G38_2136432 [Gigaspora rosea]
MKETPERAYLGERISNVKLHNGALVNGSSAIGVFSNRGTGPRNGVHYRALINSVTIRTFSLRDGSRGYRNWIHFCKGRNKYHKLLLQNNNDIESKTRQLFFEKNENTPENDKCAWLCLIITGQKLHYYLDFEYRVCTPVLCDLDKNRGPVLNTTENPDGDAVNQCSIM